MGTQIGGKGAVLPGAGSERNTKIHVECHGTRQRPLAGRMPAQIERHHPAEQDEVFVVVAQSRPDCEKGGHGLRSRPEIVVGVSIELHGRQKTVDSRRARACSGPRRPVF